MARPDCGCCDGRTGQAADGPWAAGVIIISSRSATRRRPLLATPHLPPSLPLPRLCPRQLSKDFEKKLELKESPDKGVYVKDLIQFVAKGVSELNNVLKVERA